LTSLCFALTLQKTQGRECETSLGLAWPGEKTGERRTKKNFGILQEQTEITELGEKSGAGSREKAERSE